ncbi:PKD domain-containing protein [Ferruginibacter sp. SUN106]|uniref:PKD domain-containing protein n=1 Tax=Ferruginibacter sp. SUN106 TaxID=2978348 RepID=UPI003D3651CD
MVHKVAAQQANVWHFGINAGLNFNVNPPQPLTGGALISFEGCASFCNKKGQLLFYTDGTKVYNRNHAIMPNGSGLAGDNSSTQAAIIIPNPGDSDIYYIFTSDCSENSFVKGYNFSVVDMRLNGGLGNVTAQKNINLYKPCTERLAAVKAANGIDYWVITKGLNNNQFAAYKVDCKGVNLTPVLSNAGIVHTFDPRQYVGTGQMKVSPDGKKLCLPISWPVTKAQLFDFDNITGKVSNAIDLSGYTQGVGHIYGVEFSPNSKLLYISTVFDNSINQYDITSGDPVTINASKYVIGTSLFLPNSLQLSPDKRIFVAFAQNTNVSVINNPDVYGPGCNYAYAAVDLNDKLCWAGLPSFIASLFDNSSHVDFTHAFIDCHSQFTGSTDLAGNLEWKWDFGDGSVGAGQTINHSFKKAGTYDVTLKVITSSSSCGPLIADSFSVTKQVTITNNIFAVDYGYSGNCVNQPTKFFDSTVLSTGTITSSTWDFGDGFTALNLLNPVHTYTAPGKYSVKLLVTTSGICKTDSMVKDVYIGTPPATAFSITSGCENTPLQFTDQSAGSTTPVNSWKWFFGDGDSSELKNPLHSYRNYGNYTVQLQVASFGCLSPAIVTHPVVIDSKPNVLFDYQYPCLDKATLFTNGSSNVFGTIISNTWLFGDNTSSASINPVHQYTKAGNPAVSLTLVTQNGCSVTLTKTITVIKAFANAGRDTITLFDKPIQLNGSGGGTYSWRSAANLNDPSIPDPIARLKSNELFILTTTSAEGCVATDDVLVKVVPVFDIYIPAAFTPNSDGSNDVLRPSPIGIDHINYFKVYNRFGQELFSTKELGKGWDGRISGVLQPIGSFAWMVQAVDIYGRVINKQGTSVLIR